MVGLNEFTALLPVIYVSVNQTCRRSHHAQHAEMHQAYIYRHSTVVSQQAQR